MLLHLQNSNVIDKAEFELLKKLYIDRYIIFLLILADYIYIYIYIY